MGNTARSQRRRVRLAPEVRRSQLLDAAAAVVVRDGSARFTMESLAQEAGVSVGLAYNYFNDRSGVLRALFEQAMSSVDAASASVIAAAPTIAEKLVSTMRLSLDEMERNGAIFHILVDEPNVDAALTADRQARIDGRALYWTDILRAHLDVSAEEAVLLADQFQAAANAVVRRWLRGQVPRQTVEETWERFVLDGLSSFGPVRH